MDIEAAFKKLEIVEGGNIYALYQMTPETEAIMNSLENKHTDIKELRSLTRIITAKNIPIGSHFIKHMSWAPLPDHLRSLNKLYCLNNGLDPFAEDNKFCLTWMWLYCMFETYSYGWSDKKVFIGNSEKGHRRCRFCPNTDDSKFGNKENAHAISEFLGNKKLFCPEECTACNSEFARFEEHFKQLMDVRRTMYNVSGKHSSKHCVPGKNFVIRPDGVDNQPLIYLKRSCLPEGIDEESTFSLKLEHGISIVNENIYKAVVKYVINLLPSEHLKHFSQTIQWLKGSMCSDELPPMLVGYHNRLYKQPVIDIFINSRKNLPNTPYCTAILYTCDLAYMFIVPFCAIDAGRFKKSKSVMSHYRMMAGHNYVVNTWECQNTSEYWKGTAWCNWNMTPGMFKIMDDDDPVFDLHKSPYTNICRENPKFPDISQLGEVRFIVKNMGFDSLTTRAVSNDELIDSSVNLLYNNITFVDARTINLEFSILVRDTGNTEPFFGYSIDVDIKTARDNVSFYRISGDEIILSEQLKQNIYMSIFKHADETLEDKRSLTQFKDCTLCRLFNIGTIRIVERHAIKVNNADGTQTTYQRQ